MIMKIPKQVRNDEYLDSGRVFPMLRLARVMGVLGHSGLPAQAGIP